MADKNRVLPKVMPVDKTNARYLMAARAEKRAKADEVTLLKWRADDQKRQMAILKRHGPKVTPSLPMRFCR